MKRPITPDDFKRARAEIADLLKAAKMFTVTEYTQAPDLDALRKITVRMNTLIGRYLEALATRREVR